VQTVRACGARLCCKEPVGDPNPTRPTLSTEEVLPAYQQAVRGRFQHLVELLHLIGARPLRVLEYDAGQVSVGLALSRWLPDAEVVIHTTEEAIFEELREHQQRREYDNVRLVCGEKPVEDEPFDLLVLSEVLEYQAYPHKLVERLQQTFLKKNGVVATFTRFGTSQTTGNFGDWRPERLWNFDLRDLQAMFSPARDFQATFASFDAAGKTEVNAAGELQGHWVCVFRNGAKLGQINLAEKIARTRPYESVAACMIASNEEDWIGGAIKSMWPIADRIVVAINNSEDGTRDICERLGVEVREVEFDNFSQVRNESKAGLEEDWIFWMDADERLAGTTSFRKYLYGRFFPGYAIRQNHLMLDLPGTYDLPVRLFRNRPEYKWLGYIHEHCEDTSKMPFDDPIAPTMVLPDVDIAHYGYLNEKVRRYKCSARNMELLLRDVEDNGYRGRVLTWVLVIRDYLNIVKWYLETGQSIRRGSREHDLLSAAVSTYIAKFEGSGHRYESLVFPMYQEALAFLAKFGLRYGDCPAPPFEIGLALFGAVGGLEDDKVDPQTQWFRDADEYARFFCKQGDQLVSQLRVSQDQDRFGHPAVERAEQVDLPDPRKLLETGLNVITSGAA